MILLLLCLPLAGALSSWIIKSDTLRRIMLVSVAFVELLLALYTWVETPAPIESLFCLDPIGRLVLTVSCILFFAASLYGVEYLRSEDHGARRDYFQGLMFTNAPEASFIGCLLLFLASAVLVAITHNFGFLWVGIETTTLVSAPLIYFHRHRRSLEATWKYLIICSVGIALALVGNLLLDISMQTGSEGSVSMTLEHLTSLAPGSHQGWFRAAFVFLLIGYGTKMGLAPMHTWLPDAHSEAPSLVSALLSGALLNCAFLGIFRAHQVSLAAGLGDFSSTLLITFGLLSLLTAALFIVGQGDFKRMLAYSSVEHMGILLLGLGLAGGALNGAASLSQGLSVAKAFSLHMVCHSFIKAALFMIAGNILAQYHTKSCMDVTGLARSMPLSGALWLAGIIAITGSPPFGLFISEFSILQSMLIQGLWLPAAGYLVLIGVIFVGMISPALHMYRGKPGPALQQHKVENVLTLAPSALLLTLALVLGLFMPEWLEKTFLDITSLLYTGGTSPAGR